MVTLLQDLQLTGLTAQESTNQLKQNGFNELPSTQNRNFLKIIWGIIKEPIFLLLISCGIIYLFLGDAQEALILIGFVFFIVGINLYQEQKTEQSLEALRDLSSPRAMVIRDGEKQRIAGREVVKGDLIVLAEGDRVPADAVLLWSTHLTVDESLLTGESVPVRKRAKTSDENTATLAANTRPGGDDLPCVYSGTLVVQGQAIAEVQAIGIYTEMGKIGKALLAVEQEDTVLQKETRSIVARLTIIAITICVAVVIIYGLTRVDWLNGFLAGLTLAMAILPNEIPVVLAIFLALGAWRFSQQKVLTRRVPVVETLGSTTVLCVDKTGTLTFNKMSVKELFTFNNSNPYTFSISPGEPQSLPEEVHSLIEFGILASRKDPFDPMEKALQQVGEARLATTEHLHPDWKLLYEYPLSAELLAMSCVWEAPNGELMVAAKGSPEAIIELCHFDETQKQDLTKYLQAMATNGLRVLGVAHGRQTGSIPKVHADSTSQALTHLDTDNRLPQQQHDFEFEFVGLIGLEDPVRPTVAPAIKECYSAGIRVVMITGDYPATAQNIARQIGLSSPEQVISGQELEQMSEAELVEKIKTVNIFARVIPEQKLLIVNAFKKLGEIVAMTGDGVNDAPALKSAQVGIAMGERGTDVARESADLVLLEDDFLSIVKAIRLSRNIFDNLKKGMAYTLAVHIPIAGMSLIPLIFGWPLILLPIHIAFLHLIIDPACTVVFEGEPAESNIMSRPPRNPKEPLFNNQTLYLALFQGISVLLVLVIVFAFAYYKNKDEFAARTLAFSVLIISNLAMILTNRSWSFTILEMLQIPNKALWWVLGGALSFLALTLYIPALRHLFSFSALSFRDLLIALFAGGISIIWFEIFKLWKLNTRS